MVTRLDCSVTILNNIRLIDGAGRVWDQAAVHVTGERISAVTEPVGPEAGEPDAEILDLAGKIVIPGLINCHAHVCIDGSADPVTAWNGRSFTENVLVSARHAEEALRAGVTTIRDLGGRDGVDLGLKQAVESGLVAGPRLLVSGRLLCMTGGTAHFIGLEVDGPAEARKGARAQIKAGADVIKVMATGGVMTPGVDPGASQLTYEELRAAVEEAEKAGKLTASHAQGTEGIKNAVRAGVDSIEHGFYFDDEVVEMMLARGTYFVPTLAPLPYMIEHGREAGVPQFMIDKAKRAADAHLASFRLAREAGVPIAAGNDGGTPFNRAGNLAGELECMVRAGMSPAEALDTAHSAAAQLLRMEDQIGTVEPGKLADLVVLDGDPLADIAAVRQVHRVFKGGQVV